jgi:hypothetical protein
MEVFTLVPLTGWSAVCPAGVHGPQLLKLRTGPLVGMIRG